MMENNDTALTDIQECDNLKLEKIKETKTLLKNYKLKHKKALSNYKKEIKKCNKEVDLIIEDYRREFKILRYKNTMTMNKLYLWAKREIQKCNDKVIDKSGIDNCDKIKENAYNIFKNLK